MNEKEDVMNMFSKFVDSLRPNCDHMNEQEYEDILAQKKNEIEKLWEQNEQYNNNIHHLQVEIASLKDECASRDQRYIYILEKYNNLRQKLKSLSDEFNSYEDTRAYQVPSKETSDKYYKIGEAAQYLGMKEWRLRYLADNDKIKVTRSGRLRHRVFKKEDLDNYLREKNSS